MPRIKPLCASVLLAATLLCGASAQTQAASARAYVTPAQVSSIARSYLGSPYSWTGNTPWTGFSCIGLVHWVYARLGIAVPSYLQGAWSSFPHVALSALQTGDIVFFGNTEWAGLSHAAIYIGHGQLVAADNFASGVRVDNLWDAYWQQHYWGAVRVLDQGAA